MAKFHLRHSFLKVRDRLSLGIFVYPGTEVLALDRRTVAVPFSIFFGVAKA